MSIHATADELDPHSLEVAADRFLVALGKRAAQLDELNDRYHGENEQLRARVSELETQLAEARGAR